MEPVDYLISAARTWGLGAGDISRILAVWQASAQNLPEETKPVPYEVAAHVLVHAYCSGVRSTTSPERAHLLASLAEFRELVADRRVQLSSRDVALDARPEDGGVWGVYIVHGEGKPDADAVRLACAFHTLLEGDL